MLEKENFEIYLQKHNYDCGAGAAAIVLRNLGYRVNYKNLLLALEVSRRNGTRATNLENYFRKRNFSVACRNYTSVKDLRQEVLKGHMPIVAYQGSGTRREMDRFEGGHYSVVAQITERNVYLLDPGIAEDFGDGIGWNVLKIPEFRGRWIDVDKINGDEVFYVRWMLSVGIKRNRQ